MEKIYIGKTTNFKKRIYNHIWNSKRKLNSKVILYSAIRKYGSENIKWEVLYECQSIQ
jgi:predicted GIY-YIG superfamily endonuclease